MGVLVSIKMAFRSIPAKAPQAARSMATLKEVEGRIKSTANMAKITKAMQMVAVSKLKGAQTRLEAARPLMGMVQEMTAHIEAPVSKKTTFIPITTDRGLCGGVNINLTKALNFTHIANEEAAGATAEVVVVGDKGHSQVKRFNADNLVASMTGLFAQVDPNRTSEIASKMAAMDNATRNCQSLVEKLQIKYNKARQSIITTELIEIISGAEALKG